MIRTTIEDRLEPPPRLKHKGIYEAWYEEFSEFTGKDGFKNPIVNIWSEPL